MKKLIPLFFLLIILIAIFLSSCTTQQRLHKTGTYTISSREGSVTTFKGVKGTYNLISDTLKVGDNVLMINVKRIK